MGKKMRELDAALSVDRRRSCDDISPNHNEQTALEQSALRKSVNYSGHSSMIKTNGFAGEKFKIHTVGRVSAIQHTKVSKEETKPDKSPTPQRGITPRQRYHQLRT